VRAHPTSGNCARQVKLCKEQVEWARVEKRTFLRQRIEARLGTLYLETKDYPVRPSTRFRRKGLGC
jgi:hypothetical protein